MNPPRPWQASGVVSACPLSLAGSSWPDDHHRRPPSVDHQDGGHHHRPEGRRRVGEGKSRGADADTRVVPRARHQSGNQGPS